MSGIQNTVVAAVQLTGAVFTAIMLVCLVLMSRTQMMRREVYTGFVVVFAIMMVYLTGDALGVLYDGRPGDFAGLIVRQGNMAAFVLVPLLVLTAAGAMLTFLQNRELQRRLHVGSAFFTLAAEIMVFSSRWTHWVYYIDSANVYHRGPAFLLFTVLGCMPGAVVFFFVIARWKSIPRIARFYLLFLILVPVIMIPFMMLNYGLPLMQLCLLVDMLFAFLMAVIAETRIISLQQRERAQERQRMVVAQLKPHFLSNALLSISGDPNMPPDARDALNAFSRYLRHNLTVLESDEPVPVSEELEQVKNYLLLEKRRFGDKLNFEIQPRVSGFRVPPLSVQTLVENAVRHGITHGTGHGTVKITAGVQDAEAWLCVADDGIGFDPAMLAHQPGQHTGLKATRERVHDMCGGRLQLESQTGAGTRATLWIPLKEHKT